MLVTISVRVSEVVTTVTNPPPLATGVVVASTASLRFVALLVTMKLGLMDWESVRPGTIVEEASMELAGRPAVLLKWCWCWCCCMQPRYCWGDQIPHRVCSRCIRQEYNRALPA